MIGSGIIDAHHHLWDKVDFSEFSPYLEPQFLDDMSRGPEISATVYVDCLSNYRPQGPQHLRCVGETEFVHAIAARSVAMPQLCAAIIPFADLRLGDRVEEVLEAHITVSSRVRGIRHSTVWDAEPSLQFKPLGNHAGMMGDAQFRKGFARLEQFGLSFDAWLYHPQIPELTALARAFPGTPIVLDHVGGPIGIGPYAGRQDEVWSDWRGAIADLAKCDNVFIKLGGLTMPLTGIAWSGPPETVSAAEIFEKTSRYYRFAIDCFSPARCMLESNFPVDKHCCGYGALWAAFDLLAAPLSTAERQDLFGGTAARFYRIGEAA